MAGQRKALLLHLFAGEPIFGLWCPSCLLPSGYQVDLFAVSLEGVRAMGPARRCYDCGRKLKGEVDV